MQSNTPPMTAQQDHGGEDNKGADENLDATTAPAGSGVGHGGSPLRASAQGVVSPDPKTPPSQLSRPGSKRRASAKSPRRVVSPATLTSTPSADRDDTKELHSKEMSRSRSRHKRAAARQRHEGSVKQQQTNVSSTPPADDARSPRSPQSQPVSSPESKSAMSPAFMSDVVFSTPPTTDASKGALSSPHRDTSSLLSPAIAAASPTQRDASTVDATISKSPEVEDNTATKSRASQKRSTVKTHKMDESRTTSPRRTSPIQISKADTVPKKDGGAVKPTSPGSPGEANFFSTVTTPEAQGQATTLSSSEYHSPVPRAQSPSDAAEATTITAQRDVGGAASQAAPKSALRGLVKRKASRVSIRPSDGKHDKDEASPADGTAVKAGKRPSRASFKGEPEREDSYATANTQSSLKSAASKKARRMSVRSVVLESSMRSMVSQETSRLFIFVVVFGAVLISVLASIILLVITRSDPAALVACRSARCTEVMAGLRAIVDPHADPCRDFYAYVCNSWLLEGGSFFADNVHRSLSALASALGAATRGTVDDRQGMGVLLHVHASCEQYVAGGGWSLEAVLAEADDQLFLSSMVRAPSFGEMARLLIKASMKIGLATVIQTEMIRHQKDALLYLSTGKSLMKRFTTLRRKREMATTLMHVLSFFGHGDAAPAEVVDIVQMDYAVSKIVDVAREPPQSKVSFPDVLGGTLEGVSVQEWVDYLNEHLPPSRQLNGSEPVMTSGLTEIRSVLRVISDRGVRMASLYLASYLAVHVAWMEIFRARVKAERLPTSFFCLNLTSRVLTQIWPQLVSRLIPVPLDTAAVVATVFDYVRKASTGLGVLSWLNEEERLEVAQTVVKTSLVARLPVEEGVDYSGFAYVDVNVSTAAATNDTTSPMKRFVATYLRAMAYDRGVLFEHPPSQAQTMMVREGHTGSVRYVADIGTLLVPGLYQMEPYAYSSAKGYMPEYFNHGTLGVLLSGEVAKITAAYGRGTARVGPPLAERTLVRRGRFAERGAGRHYMDMLYCLLDLHAGLGFKHNASGTTQERHAELFRRAQGMRLAYNALLESFRAASPDYDVFSTYWPQAQWAFFVRACLMLCTKDQTPNPLTPRENCLLPLHNMDEFAGAFNCRTKPGFVKGRCHM